MSVNSDINIRGFTLIEVVVALAIVSVALLALFNAGSDAAKLHNEQRERLYAGWVAHNVLAEHKQVRHANNTAVNLSRSGVMKMGGSDWRYSINIVPAIESEDAIAVDRVALEITAPESETYRYEFSLTEVDDGS